jgi:DNA topoisomerase I
MSKHIIIVESPAKSKTIKKFLGKDYEVLATYGHMRDLEPKSGSVDPNNQFQMKYTNIAKNKPHLDKIVNALKKADTLYLATDPDREGEAIAWHLTEILAEKNLLRDRPVHRVAFYEITKSAIQEAMTAPRTISMDLVNAQQARRALDYLVGFNLSPLLWKKIRRGLSAGRVQSPALKMIVEREIEIEKFKPREYWSIVANNCIKKENFSAKLTQYENKKLSQFSVKNTDQAHAIESELRKLANGKLLVEKVEKKQRKRHPAAPFITSTLQQEAIRKLGFTARKAMITAQQLYEGIDIGGETVGLITYMRTDSVNLANEAIADIRSCISKRYGAENLPASPRFYKTKAKNAQEAHEAIRPTAAKQTPTIIKAHLTKDQFRLYELIWKRTIACQMIHATIDTVTVDLSCGEGNMFRANGSTIRTPGFLSVYQEDTDDSKKESNEDNLLPPMAKGDKVDLLDIATNQHFTEPPPRYTEASLVKALEEHGIGRPSTYAAIIHTLQQRDYASLDKKRFKPTDLGRVVNRFLSAYFDQYVDYNFTANLEDQLDAVSRGEKNWIPLLEAFWGPFTELIQHTDKNVKRADVTSEIIDEECPRCKKPLMIRLGRSGLFVGCSTYPECEYTRNLTEPEPGDEPTLIPDRKCEKCQSDLIIKQGPYGKFIGCTSYPECNFIESLEKPADTQVACPSCQQGSILRRRSRRGKTFYSCSRYPDCKYALWDHPINQACPECHWPVLTEKVTKKQGTRILCPQENCKYTTTRD